MRNKTHPLFKDLLGSEVEYDNETFFLVGIHPDIGITWHNLNDERDKLCLLRHWTSHWQRIERYNQLFINHIKALDAGYFRPDYWTDGFTTCAFL